MVHRRPLPAICKTSTSLEAATTTLAIAPKNRYPAVLGSVPALKKKHYHKKRYYHCSFCNFK
jgi:hypothetical protein